MHQQASGSVTQNFVRVSSTMPKLTKRKKTNGPISRRHVDRWKDRQKNKRTGRPYFIGSISTNPEDCHLKVNSVMLVYAKIIALQQACKKSAQFINSCFDLYQHAKNQFILSVHIFRYSQF